MAGKTAATTVEIRSKSKSNDSTKRISYWQLFRYAGAKDYVLLTIAVLASVARALCFPLIIVIYSEIVAMFIDRNLGTTSVTHFLPLFGGGRILVNASYEMNMQELKNDAWSFGILGTMIAILILISGIIHVDVFNRVALTLVTRIRRQYFQATIRQDIGWHDVIQNQNFALNITDNIEKIRGGISESIGHFIHLLFDIILSVIISFVYGWRLTLTICAYLPLTIIINYLVTRKLSRLTTQEQNGYSKASSAIEEIFAGIRTVVAFGGEKVEVERYEQLLQPAIIAGKIKGIFSGLSDALFKGLLFLCSAAAFWYGVHLILDDRYKDPEDKEYTPAILMIVICGIIVGAQHITHIAPFLESFATACGSAVGIFAVVDTPSKIDPLADSGKRLNYGLKGIIEFRDVFFCYPSREDSFVLRGFNLKVDEGETVALVGASGSGKSTCLQMLQRFYDPIFGKVLLDNENIRNYNVHWLRSNMAVVGQEPVLFFGTIEENIRYGKMDATQKEIEDAAKASGAHEFIIELPNSYNTEISEKGVQLSGGQRQRIAIARALIQNPKILLLDEATSALDYQSEKIIQDVLNKASKGRTTLVVSHRLSAVCNADRIVLIDDGRIIEQGTHEKLMQEKGLYYRMITDPDKDVWMSNNVNEINNELDNKLDETNGQQIPRNKQFDSDHPGERMSDISPTEKNCAMLANTKQADLPKDTTEAPTQYLSTFYRILQLARSEWCILIIGALCSAVYGCTQPAFAIVYAQLYGALTEVNPDDVLSKTAESAIISVIVGIVAATTCITQNYMFNSAGVSLVKRFRLMTINNILLQEMTWFDEKENSVGALSARLSGDTSSVQGALGFPLSNIIQALFNFICSFAIGFNYSWELALICLTTAPFMVASVIFEAKFSNKSALEEKKILEETSRIATETIAQIRTVASLRREADLIKAYDDELQKYCCSVKRKLRFRGLVNSLGVSIMLFGYAITLTYGGYMCADGKIKYENIMKISNSLLYGLFILAQSLALTPAFNAAIVSANRLFNIIDRRPRIQSSSSLIVPSNKQLWSLTGIASHNGKNGSSNNNNTNNTDKDGLRTLVDFQNINFRYPTRREQVILRSFNLKIKQGQTVALVGASGSGKSTCIQLLLRYYDPDTGQIMIDKDNIREDLTLNDLRKSLGIVSQEPVLFEKTIASNIAYGDNTRTVPMDEIITAAKLANAHEFIMALPSGYETCLGARGTQLSGGQKQRIAIARALIRNPRILLLDEATSALDMHSERVVQNALNEACNGRTCIVIAHRLSTVQNADLICILQNGRIAECGRHSDLLAQNGLYAKLYHTQPKTQ